MNEKKIPHSKQALSLDLLNSMCSSGAGKTDDSRDENGRKRWGKYLNHSRSCIFFAENGNGNRKAGWENETGITGYREQNISNGNMSITIGKR